MGKGEHYVYALAYPEDYLDGQKSGTVFYIGKGIGNRIDQHEREAMRNKGRNSHKMNVIRKIQGSSQRVVKTILAYFDTDEEACLFEIALIFFMDGLTNKTIGGNGIVGLVRTEEHRRNIGKAHKGRVKSEEERRNLSIARKGKPLTLAQKEAINKAHASTAGKTLSEAHRQKIGETNKKRYEDGTRSTLKLIESNKARMGSRRRPYSEEHRRKLSIANTGKRHTEEARRKDSEAHKGKKLTEEHKRKISKAGKGRIFSEDHRRRISEAAKLREARKREQYVS